MPYIFYINPWEIDAGQPRVTGIKATHRFRHRVNLQRCEARFAALVDAFEWIPLCDLIDGLKTPARLTAIAGITELMTWRVRFLMPIDPDGQNMRILT